MRWLLIVGVLVLAGCASSQPAASPTPEPTPSVSTALSAELLPGERWVLVGAQITPDPTPFEVTLAFQDGKVAGQGPVNTYSAPVTVGAVTLQIGMVMSTKMGGSDEAMAAESAYFQALSTATTWEVVDSSLTLLDSAGSPLLSYAAPDSPAAFAVGLIGEAAAKAKQQIADAGYEVRVVSVDGDMRPVTMDYVPNRINLTIVDGSVTMASAG